MLLTKEVTISLSYQAQTAVLTALQGDSCRALAIHFVSGDTPWEIPTDGDVFVQYTCADGTAGIFDTLPDGAPAYEISGDTLTVRFPAAMCAVPGTTKAQVTIFSGGEQLSTFPVELRVLPQVTQKPGNGSYVNLQSWLLSYVTEEAFITAVLAALPNGDEVYY